MPSFFFLSLSLISGRNALFSMFTFDGITMSYVSGTLMLSVIAFGSCCHKFSGTGTSKVLQICLWLTLHTLLCRCVYSYSDMRFSFCVQSLNITSFSLLPPSPPLTFLSLFFGLSLSLCLCLSVSVCLSLSLSHSHTHLPQAMYSNIW